ncbi:MULTISPECIES: M16 family metallopeptidase [Ochrobactrum]|uniref:Pitrilysin family protein n=1 Tax=Ochrobactrum chromiisoli TaxID=2993941 RepID=A0ABT3QSA4_9HYPH|nr:pitrilysin family protein [Ochrobactrum chromiisoli]MCX2698405.1 pitrilysin family protein [Ochrobactrum chromiisoli]
MHNPSLRRLLLSTALGFALVLPLASGSVQAQTAAPAATTEAAASLSPQKLPEIKQSEGISSFTLENGLQVVVIPDHRAPVVTQMIWYHVGSADEAAGKSGIAHFLEHLMFKGTKTYPAGEFSAKVAAIGGQENAFTSYDYTAYFQRVTPDALEMVMGYESDRMANLVLNEEAVKTERDVILEERSMRVDSNPAAMLMENTDATLFYNHPYRVPVIGWRQEMEKLSLKDAIDFYQQYYTPNNATLVIAGDVTPERVRDLVMKTWAKIPKRAEVLPRDRPQEPVKHAARIVTLHDERVSTPSFRISWLVPSYANEKRFPNVKKGDAPALDLLGEILGGSLRSRLYQELIVKQGIASNTGASYDGDALDDGTFSVYGSPQTGKTLAEVEKAVDAQVARIIKDGVTQEELDQARNRFLKAVIFARDSQSGMARIYGSALSVGQNIEDIQKWPDLIKSVTVEQIRDAASRYLVKDQSVTSYLLPPDTEPENASENSNAAAGNAGVNGAEGAIQ